jgi:hypothetical protein
VRSIHFRVSGEMDILIEQVAEDVGASVAHFTRAAAIARAAAAVAVVAGCLALAAPASAFTPPELYVRMQPVHDTEPASDWIPLASAPALDYLGGYQIGYKVQDSGEPFNRQDLLMQVTGAPDGSPTQPDNAGATCDTTGGTTGEIVTAGFPVQFEGDGTYTVKVSIGPVTGDDDDCVASGQSTTGSFSVPTMVTPVLVGQPFSFRAKPLAGNPFVGVQAPDPPGGFGELRCTLGKLTAPDYGLTDAPVEEDDFPRPGRWSCVARGAVNGQDENFDDMDFATPFSAPLAVEVHSDFRRRLGKIAEPMSRRPRFTFKAEWPGLSKGGHVELTVSHVGGCRNHRKHLYKLRKVGTYRAAFGAKDAQLRIKRPRRDGYFLGKFAFSGTPYIRAGVDPNPVYLQESFGRFGFAASFPPC